MTADSPTRPGMRPLLAGLRILSLEHYGAGPYGTQLLAELGAEVIKVEAPATGGDVSRTTGPYFLGPGDSQFFQAFSRGKKSAALDLKTPADRAVFERLVRSADAVVNNLRGDQPGRLGLTYRDLAPLNPAIVAAHLSAYGRGNSRETWPGYDYLMQAEAGFMSLTGEPDAPPTRFGLSMVDYMTGAVWAVGLLAALLSARATGRGCDVDTSLFEVALHQTGYPATWAMNEAHDVGRLPRGAHPSIAPSQLVRTRDGWGFLMCQSEKFWILFCEVCGRADLADDPRFVDIPSRRANLAELTSALDAHFQTDTTEAWRRRLAGRVPFAPVLDLPAALANPFVEEIGMRQVVAHPERPEGLHMLACPLRVDGARPEGRRAPAMGEHTEALISALRAPQL